MVDGIHYTKHSNERNNTHVTVSPSRPSKALLGPNWAYLAQLTQQRHEKLFAGPNSEPAIRLTAFWAK